MTCMVYFIFKGMPNSKLYFQLSTWPNQVNSESNSVCWFAKERPSGVASLKRIFFSFRRSLTRPTLGTSSLQSRRYLFYCFCVFLGRGGNRAASAERESRTKSMFLSATFDFQRMRSLGTTQMVRVTSALSTLVMICMCFHLYPLSRAFSNRGVFDKNAQRFSVDRRPKRIEMYAFSNENTSVWKVGFFALILIDVLDFLG